MTIIFQVPKVTDCKHMYFKAAVLEKKYAVKNLKTNFYFSNKVYKLTEINKAIKDFRKEIVIRPLIKMT